MPNLAGVLDDGADDCGIYLNVMAARLSWIMKCRRCKAFAVISSIWRCHVRSCEIVTPRRRVQFTCSICLSFIVIGRMSGFFLEAYAYFLHLIVVLCHFVGGSPSSAAVSSEQTKCR